jgi:hypothetical protein
MGSIRNVRLLLVLGFVCLALLGTPQISFGQSDERPSVPVEHPIDVDVEVQLHLLVASNAAESVRLPELLAAVARDLRPSLPFSNYRLGASFLSRVKNGRPLNTKGVGRSLLVTPALESSVLPTFYEIGAGMVNLKTDVSGRAVVQVSGFRFGLRIPLQSGTSQTKDGGYRDSTILYEPVGITTDLTMREGDPVVVGTLDAGRPNETLVLVLVAKRASTR